MPDSLQRRVARLAAQAAARDATRAQTVTPEQARDKLADATIGALAQAHGADTIQRQLVAAFPGWAGYTRAERTAAIIRLWKSDAEAMRWLRLALSERATA